MFSPHFPQKKIAAAEGSAGPHPGHEKPHGHPVDARLCLIPAEYNNFASNGSIARLDGGKIDLNGTGRILFRIKSLGLICSNRWG
jgi:hypothetical protein